MEVVELKDAKKELENQIKTAVNDLVESFKRETAISPCNISIKMKEVTKIGLSFKEFVVGEVNVEVEI